MRKGSQILVEGRLETRSWDDTATGAKKYRTEIIADTIQFGQKGTGAPQAGAPKTSAPKAESEESELDTIEYPDEQINAEDIPF